MKIDILLVMIIGGWMLIDPAGITHILLFLFSRQETSGGLSFDFNAFFNELFAGIKSFLFIRSTARSVPRQLVFLMKRKRYMCIFKVPKNFKRVNLREKNILLNQI
jgi:hypothetical protein